MSSSLSSLASAANDNLKDRTAEFKSIVGNGALYGRQGHSAAPANSSASSSAFIQAANRIARHYSTAIPAQLDQLRKLAKNHSLFDERPQQEFLVAADALKRQLSALNRSLQELKTSTTSSINQSHQSLQHSQAGNKTATEHQKALLLILQTWIAQGFKALEGINEQRNEILKAQKSRKEQFGTVASGSAAAAGFIATAAQALTSRASTPPLSNPQTHSSKMSSPLPSTASSRLRQPIIPNVVHVGMVTPPPAAQPARPMPHADEHGHVAIDLQQQTQTQALLYQDQQQQQNEPLLGSLRNRGTALTSLESTINELGTIYQQLAHMVSQQGDIVQRIDMNIEDMAFNVQRGQGQLARYLRRVSSGRMLLAKIFFVLILFIILMKFVFF